MTGFVILSAQKPPEFSPCNGCGQCCQNEACGLSKTFLRSTVAPCVALEWDGARYRCGVVQSPRRYLPHLDAVPELVLRNLFAEALGIGRGCDSGARAISTCGT